MIGFVELSKKEYLEAVNYDLPPEALAAIEKEKQYQQKLREENKPNLTSEELEVLARLDKQSEYQKRFKK